MKSVVLCKSDFVNNDVSAMSWEAFLEDIGVETHTNVAGRLIDREIETVTVYVGKVEYEEGV